MASRLKHDINQKCSFCVSNISQGNVDVQKSASTQPFFSENLKLSTVNSIPTKIMAAALLLYTQLENDTFIMQEQYHTMERQSCLMVRNKNI